MLRVSSYAYQPDVPLLLAERVPCKPYEVYSLVGGKMFWPIYMYIIASLAIAGSATFNVGW